MTEFESPNCEICPISTLLRKRVENYSMREDNLIKSLASEAIDHQAEHIAFGLEGSSLYDELADVDINPVEAVAKTLRRHQDTALENLQQNIQAAVSLIGELAVDCDGPFATQLVDQANDVLYTVSVCRSPSLKAKTLPQIEPSFVRRLIIE